MFGAEQLGLGQLEVFGCVVVVFGRGGARGPMDCPRFIELGPLGLVLARRSTLPPGARRLPTVIRVGFAGTGAMACFRGIRYEIDV